MSIPAEFLQPAELEAITGFKQRARWRQWLDKIGVRYVCTPNGTPLVYRGRLTPSESEAPGARLNLKALHGTGRKTA